MCSIKIVHFGKMQMIWDIVDICDFLKLPFMRQATGNKFQYDPQCLSRWACLRCFRHSPPKIFSMTTLSLRKYSERNSSADSVMRVSLSSSSQLLVFWSPPTPPAPEVLCRLWMMRSFSSFLAISASMKNCRLSN